MSKLIAPTFYGKVKKGKFVPENEDAFRKAFRFHENRRVAVQVKRYQESRSNQANRYYFGVVVAMIAEAMGEDDLEAVHEALKLEHNYYLAKVGNKEIRVPLSTANMETGEFNHYIERVKKWASEYLSLYIPDPGEAGY